MALLRQRAAGIDFIDELLSLAEAYLADKEISAKHPPLRIMKSVQTAFPRGQLAYSTRWRTRFQADGGQCSTAMADTVPR
jgi:hypothetical protein